jgi:hypothetical protein
VKNYKNKMNLDTIITDIQAPDWEKKLKNISYEESVDFINSVNKSELNCKIEEKKDNSLFIFTMGAIYIKAKSTKSFPVYLAELIYKHVYLRGQGHELFLEILDENFNFFKVNVKRYMWGLCSQTNDIDIVSFLKAKNSPPNILFYWLELSFCADKPITKFLLQILERIEKKRNDYLNIIHLIVQNKSQLLFDTENGLLHMNIKNKPNKNLLLLFEIDWQFTFGELELIRDFLRKNPIETSYLFEHEMGTTYISSKECAKNLFRTVFNLTDCVDIDNNFIESNFYLARNIQKVHEFFIYVSFDLTNIFKNNQFLFDTILTPQKYKFDDVICVFFDLLNERSYLSGIIHSLKTYGNKLSKDDIMKIPDILAKCEMDYQNLRRNKEYDLLNICKKNIDKQKIILSLMCMDFSEEILCLKDYILCFKAIFSKENSIRIQVSPSSPSNFREVIKVFRDCLPEFILNSKILSFSWMNSGELIEAPLLPVILYKEDISEQVNNFLELNRNLFPCKLQILLFSKTKEELYKNLKDVLDYVGKEAEITSSNDIKFMMMMEEMFFITRIIFARLKITMDDFYDIYELLPKHPTNNISEAFINNPKFFYLVTGFLEERKVKQLAIQCKEHLAKMPIDSKITDAQSELGIIVMNCSVCMAINTSDFTELLVPCGHTFCHSCSQKLVNCPNCRVKIDYRLPMKKFNIRIREDSEIQALKRQKIE